MHQAIVIGAGHNGLVAACYLASAGIKVVVLEASAEVGGMTSSRPLIAQAPRHLVSSCAIDAVYWRASSVERDLDLQVHGLRMIDHDPAWAWLGEEGQSLLLSRDVASTIAEIRKFSAVDAATYADLVPVLLATLKVQDAYSVGPAARIGYKTALKFAQGLAQGRVRRLLMAAATAPAAELIESTFVSPELRGAYACMASILGSITQDSSGLGLFATAPLHRYGVSRPVGGMQAIPEALRRRLEASDGEVRVNCRVSKIEIENGQVSGVALGNGSFMPASSVLAAIPPHVTAQLLADSGTSGASALKYAPANASGIGCFKLDLALNDRLSLAQHQRLRTDAVDLRKPTLFHGSLEQVIRAESQARSGHVPDDPPWTATILSATDPSQAPEGQDNLYMYMPAPVRSTRGWNVDRNSAEDRLLDGAARVMGDIRGVEIGRISETPEDLESRLAAKNGCIYHVDQVITRLGALRPARGWSGHKSPVAGLFLSGAGTHPGGGVSGIPGQLAARALMRSI